MNISSRTALELYFADHFDTVLFPVLADSYLEGGDLVRARKVCEIGLGHHPEQADGLFIMAEVCRAEGDLMKAEKTYKELLKLQPDHLSSAVALAELQAELERAQATITRSWKHVLKLDRQNEQALEYFKEKEPQALPPPPKLPERKPIEEEQALPPPPTPAAEPFSISPRLATFTMVAVLRNQGLHQQALQVLDMLEEKSEDQARIDEERKTILTEIE